MKSVALNVAANSGSPGGRGPIFPDGSFSYVPIPEGDESVTEPTYADLGLGDVVPSEFHETVAHFDPEFPEYEYGTNYTYGDRHTPKTTAISRLGAGDMLQFYATLDYAGDSEPNYEWINDDWGAYLIGHFTLEVDPIAGEDVEALSTDFRGRLETNAHARRSEFDAEYLVLGEPEDSRMYDTAVPLSGDSGTDANEIVRAHSGDSGKGPWYRRPLPFDEEGTEAVLEAQESSPADRGGWV